jgi:thioredoxin 1
LSVREVDTETWEAVVSGPGPVLIDIWAPWCVPCRKVRPLVEALAADLGDRLCVATLNGDDAPAIMSRYQVLSLPTLLLFVEGTLVERVVGVPKIAKLRAVVEPYLGVD